MSGFLSNLYPEVMGEWQERSKKALYRRDPEAWLYDVLGFRWHAKQREIAHAFLTERRITTKSSNGAGKSRQVGELMSWGIATHEPGELLIISSAPTLRQIEETTFAYLSANYSRAKLRNHPFPGYLTDATHWNYRETPSSKAKTLVLGQRPSDRDIVGSFQGIRAIGVEDAKTWVFIDEGGAVHDDLFVAAEAVTTGAGDNKINVIGNPDRIGTYFQKTHEDPEISQDWKPITISAFDLPTFTGEIVYPDDAEMQASMLKSGMIDPAWVEQKKRAWGEASARYRSKVLGEFPDADDFSFFAQSDLDNARDTIVLADRVAPIRLGFDVARFGDDDSTLYANTPGIRAPKDDNDEKAGQPGFRIRQADKWSKAAGTESATRAHNKALELGVEEMVIDASGLGGPIVDMIAARADGYYRVVQAIGSERSSDPTRWLNARAEWYDRFREAIRAGRIDLDPADKQLFDEMLDLRYDFTDKGAIKIESKKDMAKRGTDSPDELDAVVYAYMDILEITLGAEYGITKGDVVVVDPWDLLMMDQDGLPI